MTRKSLFTAVFLFLCQLICAQQDSIVKLDAVVISDSQLRNFSNSQSVQMLNDSVISVNNPSLTDLLKYNSALYLKENGYGMVSSASFRGTSAQQTAIIWNGININSQFTGQTDFNTITTSDFDAISIRAGGGSVLYGTGAIGGSVHLDNELRFGKKFTNAIKTGYGSFNTLQFNYQVAAAEKNWTSYATISRNSSDNDYDYPTGKRKNSNGQFENTSFSVGAAFQIDAKNTVQIRSMVYNGTRHFSLLTATETKTKYADLNTRNLVEWVNRQQKITHKLKAAYLTEHYDYYPDIASGNTSGSIAETFIAKYDGSFSINGKMLLNGIFDFTQTTGRGSDISNNRRAVNSGALLFRHKPFPKFQYEAGIRKEITGNYKSPLLYSAGARYKISDSYAIKFNGSKNFRIPTFNDLYWSDGGNPDLKPETSYQAEFGNEFEFKNIRISATGYYLKIQDMIQWLPGISAIWFPQNVTKVTSYGAEANASYAKKFGQNTIAFTANYAYTVSENDKTKKQLIYVPYHKSNAAIAYSHNRFSAHFQWLFNGEVFTLSDNNPRYNVAAYNVSNVGASWRFGKNETVTIGGKVLNLFDEEYQAIANRPFPGRNYNLYLTFNL